MSIGNKAKTAVINTKESVGERASRLFESSKISLVLALGNFASSTTCAIIAVENSTKSMPNDKISALALVASGLSAVASGSNWQQYHIDRDRQADQKQ